MFFCSCRKKVEPEEPVHPDGTLIRIFEKYPPNSVIIDFLRFKPFYANDKDETGKTALMWAVDTGRLEVVKALIKLNANIEEIDNDGWTPLMYASRRGNIEIVAELLDSGADLNRVKKGDGWLCSHIACVFGHVGVALYLIERGIDGDIVDQLGKTPWHYLKNDQAVQRYKNHQVKFRKNNGSGISIPEDEVLKKLMKDIENN